MIGLALGGNLPGSADVIKKAIDALSACLTQPRVSSLLTTRPLGPSSKEFVNAVIVGDSDLADVAYWGQKAKDIETTLGGGFKSEIWGDRLLDIDLLFVGEQVASTNQWVVPHPQMHLRDFVLDPLSEVFADWVHPILNQTIDEMKKSYSG